MPGTRVSRGLGGSLSLDMDRAAGIIYVEGVGLWTEAEVDRHFDAMALLVEQSHAAFGRARVFVDMRQAPEVQSPEVEALLGERMSDLYGEGDRVGTLVAVDLRSISVVPRVSTANRKIFDDPIAVLRWLAED